MVGDQKGKRKITRADLPDPPAPQLYSHSSFSVILRKLQI